jgi:hypothetical protein
MVRLLSWSFILIARGKVFDRMGLRGANSFPVGVGLSGPLTMTLFWGTPGNNVKVDERFVDGDVARRCGLYGS